MIRRSIALALLLGLLLVGCTASGPLGQLPPVPEDRAARILFVRPWHFAGSGASILVMIDGVELYGLDAGEHVEFIVPAGERLVGIKV